MDRYNLYIKEGKINSNYSFYGNGDLDYILTLIRDFISDFGKDAEFKIEKY